MPRKKLRSRGRRTKKLSSRGRPTYYPVMAFDEEGASRRNAGAVFREGAGRLHFSGTSHDPPHRPLPDRLHNKLVPKDLGRRWLARRLFYEQPIVLSGLTNNQCTGRNRILISGHTRKTFAILPRKSCAHVASLYDSTSLYMPWHVGEDTSLYVPEHVVNPCPKCRGPKFVPGP